METELDCFRVRTRQGLARWAAASFDLPASWTDPALLDVPEYFDALVTSAIFSVVGRSGVCRTVRLVAFWAASRTVRTVVREWRRAFGAGLPRDYGVAITFER
jgi:hypothetical protein